LNETKTVFFRDGTPRRIEFSLSLKRIDDDRIDLIGAGTSVGVSIMRSLL
jgi:phage protein U